MTRAGHAGDPRHADHERWLAALGRDTYASQRLAGIAVDVLRVHCGVDFWALLPKTLGKLIGRLRDEQQLPGLAYWLLELDEALVLRNDLMHALPVRDGLDRRVASDPSRIVNFFDVEDLDAAQATLTAAWTNGSKLLYHDGGAAVAAHTARSGGPT